MVAAMVILTRPAHAGTGHWSKSRAWGEATISYIKCLEPPTHQGMRSLQSRRCSLVDRAEVTHTDGHIHACACFSACTLCSLALDILDPAVSMWNKSPLLPSLSIGCSHGKFSPSRLDKCLLVNTGATTAAFLDESSSPAVIGVDRHM